MSNEINSTASRSLFNDRSFLIYTQQSTSLLVHTSKTISRQRLQLLLQQHITNNKIMHICAL